MLRVGVRMDWGEWPFKPRLAERKTKFRVYVLRCHGSLVWRCGPHVGLLSWCGKLEALSAQE